MADQRKIKIPQFVLDLFDPPGAVGVLVAGTVAVFAAGLDPKVLSSGMPVYQEALRQRPQLESVFLLSAIVVAGFYLIGAAAGDYFDRKPVLLVGLIGLIGAELSSAVTATGPLFLASRLLAAASVGIVMPVALGTVAVNYKGAVRATALGVVYAAMGAATALAPALVLALMPTVGQWPSFLLAAACALIALQVVRKRVPRTGRSGLRVADVAGNAIWAFGLLAITGGVVGFRADADSLIRMGLIVGGIVLLLLFLPWQKQRERTHPESAIQLRPVAVALFVGIVFAIAQTAASVQAPLFFEISQRSSPLLATIAIAPFVVALLGAGPLCGLLMKYFSPRTVIAGGLAVVGLGDVLFGLGSSSSPYPFFVLPLFSVGAGFVVGTGMRTAIIFANVPRKLPASAAAFNETSGLVGGQIGVALVTAIVANQALGAFRAAHSSLSNGQVQVLVGDFDQFLKGISLPGFRQTLASLPSSVTAQYGAAYASGVSIAMIGVGLIALLSSVVAWFAMGPESQVTSTWDYRDEREATAPAVVPAAVGDQPVAVGGGIADVELDRANTSAARPETVSEIRAKTTIAIAASEEAP